jgi:hypothetical protein
MSGHLRRLATAAMRPQPRLHPFVGSLFSAAPLDLAASTSPPPALPDLAAPGDSIDAIAAWPRGLAQPERVRDQPPRQDASPPHSSPRPPGPLLSEARTAPPGPFRPLLPNLLFAAASAASAAEPLPPETTMSWPASAEIMMSSDPAASAASAAGRAAVRAGDIERAVAVARPGRAAPLSGEAMLRGPPAGIRAPADMPRQPRLVGFAAAPRAMVQEPKDIEIHIGRVEVTAVPAASPRPAAAPARKAISLDAYLARSSRAGR